GLLYSQQIDALAPGHFHHANAIFLGNVRDAAQFGRGRDATTHPWNHREASIPLNVGMHAIVDEARRAILLVPAAPDHVHQIAERRLANLASLSISVDIENFLDGFELLTAYNFPDLFEGKGNTGAQGGPGFLLKLRRNSAQQLVTQIGAA